MHILNKIYRYYLHERKIIAIYLNLKLGNTWLSIMNNKSELCAIIWKFEPFEICQTIINQNFAKKKCANVAFQCLMGCQNSSVYSKENKSNKFYPILIFTFFC